MHLLKPGDTGCTYTVSSCNHFFSVWHKDTKKLRLFCHTVSLLLLNILGAGQDVSLARKHGALSVTCDGSDEFSARTGSVKPSRKVLAPLRIFCRWKSGHGCFEQLPKLPA